MLTCHYCGQRFPRGKRGPATDTCPDCHPIRDAVLRLEKHLPDWADRATAECKIELRYRLFCTLGDMIPRPRYPAGHPQAGQFIPRRNH